MEAIKEVSPERLVELKLELKELQSQIRDLDLPGNRRVFARHTISDEDMELHRKLGERIREIEAIFTANKKVENQRRHEDQLFIDLLKESFGLDDYLKIMQEFGRRQRGATHIRVTLKYKDTKAPEYKKKLNELYENLATIRKTLTKINMDGCEMFDMAEFMKLISPLNRMIPPLAEISKEQRSIT